MKVIKKIKSNDKTRDCFGNPAPFEHDHVFPQSKGGSNISKNKITISRKSNAEKADKTKGKIGTEWKFAVLKHTDKNGKIHGVMYIRNISWKTDDWAEVVE